MQGTENKGLKKKKYSRIQISIDIIKLYNGWPSGTESYIYLFSFYKIYDIWRGSQKEEQQRCRRDWKKKGERQKVKRIFFFP